VRRRAFTLLEVMIALGIMALAMLVLVDTQATSVLMTSEGDKIRTGAMLADEKMKEVNLLLEVEGWSSQDIEEEGDFAEFGNEEFRGDSLHLDIDPDELSDYHWAYTVRAIELQLPDLGGAAEQLQDGGYWGDVPESQATNDNVGGPMDLGDLGFGPEQLTEMLSPYLREARVIVWWGKNEEGEDQIELVTHVINPSGAINMAEDQQ
jgi:prepilin-type N-terminal cleavage/methylation domain-containing protein